MTPMFTDNEKLAIAAANKSGLALDPTLILESYELLGLWVETATPFAIRFCANVMGTFRTDEEWESIHEDAQAELETSEVDDDALNKHLAAHEESISATVSGYCPKNRDLHNVLLVGLSRVHTHWEKVAEVKKLVETAGIESNG